jgi:predicted ester cyclase
MREMARRFYEEYHRGNVEAGPELVHPTAVFHLPVGDVGTIESDTIINDLVSALQDFDWRVEDILVDGDRAAVRWVMSGMHTGPLPDAPPTGNAILLTGIAILRFEEDKIAEGWVEDDMLGFLQQLEVLPAL